MKRLISFYFLFLSAATVIHAGSGTGIIRGRVFDQQNNEPLPSATIVYGRGQGTTTGPDGTYEIITEAGQVNLSYRYVGYRSVARTVSLGPDDSVILDVGLEYEVAEIDQIVVSAGKMEQRLSELTVSMNIIRPEIIAESHITDPTELLNKTPGIEITDGQAAIRGGSGFSYGAGSRVLVLLDGLPVISADAGHVKWQYLPLENISQIEVIKGAASALYGSSALNGVINFRPARAGATPETRFYVETGIFDRPRQIAWKWWDSPRTFHSSSFSHLQKTGNTELATSIHLLYDEGYRRLNDERLGRMNFNLRHSDRNIEGLSYGANLNAGLTRSVNFLLWENAWDGALRQDESTANQLRGSFITLDPFIRLDRDGRPGHDLRTRFQYSDNSYPTATYNNSTAFSSLGEYRLSYHVLPRIRISSGLFSNFSVIRSEFHGNHQSLNLAGFTQADVTPFDRLRVTGGVRIEFNSLNGLVDGPVPLFRAGANYRLLDYTFLRASFGQGYRYPSIAEKHAATTAGSVRIVPNPSVLPESGWSSEVGIKQGLLTGTVNGQIDLALFYSRNTRMIEYLFGIYPFPGETPPFGFGFMATNVENSRVYGGELEINLNRQTGMLNSYLSGGYVFMYPVEFDPKTGRNRDVFLKYRRKHSFKLSLGSSYRRMSAGFSLDISSAVLNIDDVFLNPETRETILPGFYDYWTGRAGSHILVDPRIGYEVNDNLKISLAVKNILNTEYMGRPGDILPHRNFSIRLSGSF
jgi:outer membrane receptor protein involved in Fe transport